MNQKYLEEIIKGCIKAKTSSQEKLFKLFSEKFYGVCLYYTKNRFDAEDILHEGFIKIFENINKYKNIGSFEGWMRKIIVNTALEKFRKKQHLYSVDMDTIKDNDFFIDEKLAINLSVNDLLKFIQELSPQYKMVFNLFAIEGYSHSEISKKLGISVGTSKSNLSRARGILKEKVKNYYLSKSDKHLDNGK